MTSALILNENLTAIIHYRYRNPVSITTSDPYGRLYDVYVPDGKQYLAVSDKDLPLIFDEIFITLRTTKPYVTSVDFFQACYTKRALQLSGGEIERLAYAVENLPEIPFASSKDMLHYCMPNYE